MEYTLKISNLTCAACFKVCAMILKKFDGVESVDVKEDGRTKIVSFKSIDLEAAQAALKEKGYESVVV